MRLISINHVENGAILAKPIYDANLALLVPKGAKCSEHLKNKLIQLNVKHLYIDDSLSEGIDIEPLIADTTKLRAVTLMKEIYESQRIKDDQKANDLREKVIAELKSIVDDVISEIQDKRHLKYFTTELLGADIYHYDHAVEVMILSLLIGIQMGLDKDKLTKLGLGAILADIGKYHVADEILYKRGKLTAEEFKEMEKHVDYGYQALKNLVGLSATSRQIVALHHEKLDGTGYPNKFKGDNIPLLVRIATVCDIFSAIVSDRTYNKRISVNTALEILQSAAPTKLDPSVVQSLFQVVDIYPPGTLVKITGGQKGIVIKNTPSAPTRPLIRTFEGIDEETKYETINLMENLTLFIEEVIPN